MNSRQTVLYMYNTLYIIYTTHTGLNFILKCIDEIAYIIIVFQMSLIYSPFSFWQYQIQMKIPPGFSNHQKHFHTCTEQSEG